MNCLPEGIAIIKNNADIVYTNKSLHRILKSNKKDIAEVLINLENLYTV